MLENQIIRMKGLARFPLLCLLGLALHGCGTDSNIPPQTWKGIEFVMETRPGPPQVGVNEVLVSASRPGRIAAYNMVMSLRMDRVSPWVQGIQDGHTGIFRRALHMAEAGPQTISVHIILLDSQAETTLEFPLTVK